MADISIIIPLDGSKTQFAAMCETLARVEDEIAQIVVVRPSSTEIEEADLADLPVEPLVVDHDGSLGELWNAGIEASTSEYVYPASCRIRFSKASYHVLTAQLTRAPLDLLFFHLQEFDLATQEYTSTRLSMRLSLPATPFQTSQNAQRIFQRLRVNASSAVYSRRFIDEQGFRFSSVAAFDDDPNLIGLILAAESISYLPWALAVLAYDSTTMFDEVDYDAFLKRYANFERAFDENLPVGEAFDSFIEWAVSFASRHIASAPDELADRMFDAMAESIIPIIGDQLGHRDDTALMEGIETLMLSTLSRRELINTVIDIHTAGGEERYRSEMLQIMLERSKRGSAGTKRPRKRGLFRR